MLLMFRFGEKHSLHVVHVSDISRDAIPFCHPITARPRCFQLLVMTSPIPFDLDLIIEYQHQDCRLGEKNKTKEKRVQHRATGSSLSFCC